MSGGAVGPPAMPIKGPDITITEFAIPTPSDPGAIETIGETCAFEKSPGNSEHVSQPEKQAAGERYPKNIAQGPIKTVKILWPRSIRYKEYGSIEADCHGTREASHRKYSCEQTAGRKSQRTGRAQSGLGRGCEGARLPPLP